MQVTFKLEGETKGAFMYRDVDAASGEPLDMRDSQIGTLYLRKNALRKGMRPQTIHVTVTFLDETG